MPFSSNQEISSNFTGDLIAGFVVDFGAFRICGAAINLCPIRVLEVAVANVRADSTADKFVYGDMSG